VAEDDEVTMRGVLARLLAPRQIRCGACDMPFQGPIRVEPHVTTYRELRGIFALCEGCWAERTPEDRLPYYEHRIERWKEDGETWEGEPLGEGRVPEEIREAVRNGG
jgi:hypothetical protein